MLELFSESISFSELIVAVFEIVVGHSNPSVSTCIVNEPLVYAPILPRFQVSNPATSDVGVNDPVTNVVPVGIWSDIITPLAINAERFCHDILYIRIFQIYVLVIFTDFEIDTSASKQSYTWFSFISSAVGVSALHEFSSHATVPVAVCPQAFASEVHTLPYRSGLAGAIGAAASHKLSQVRVPVFVLLAPHALFSEVRVQVFP